MQTIKISTDFSITPGARYYTDGPDSGEEFFDKILNQRFQTALTNKEVLRVDLDGTFGYAPSFLSEAFGLLSEKYGINTVLKHLEIVSFQEPRWKTRILEDFIPNSIYRQRKEPKST